ncbi:SGNH/GDSL hydrolase family protein [Winogradskyella aurantia]|uniref:G-D-S-L family lipolytic protein n=1 Tax=Winogradskyella aurantia TaxID=1915063 RepID=A0A265UZF4_9FLAO|nr:G-D-S-L family lipolytic protein [Winogradskyella aurantia]OZV70676.1 G-D-S-L family lipolytic protein [Winogradskyella aurantia]
MKRIRYIGLSLLLLGLFSCENDTLDDLRNRVNQETEPLPELTAGEADFSNYVALGASFTAGFTDGGLFIATQENSFPNIMANKFANAGGGAFTQPFMNDNIGGLALGGNRIADPRLVFGGAGPVPLESIIGPVTVTTDIATNNPVGPFNNLGIPGSKSFHLLAPGYGNIQNLPSAANPYAVRVTGNAPNATILELAIAQDPTFFSLSEIGGNDVLGYALSGGDGSNPITPVGTFDASINAIVAGLTANGAKGVIGNIPNITSLSHFTSVPFNPLDPSNEDFGPLIPTLNNLFGALNGVYAFLESQGAINDAAQRSIIFSDTAANAVVVFDENLADISPLITQTLLANPSFPAFLAQFGLPPEAAQPVAGLLGLIYGQSRQATADDLFVLPSSSVIGTVNQDFAAFLQTQGLSSAVAAQFATEGVTLPLEDKWVLLPSEQDEIASATQGYNATISTVASSNGLALVDLNSILEQASSTGIVFDDYTLTTDLVVGGLVSLDGVHLTSRGYALMANAFLEAIDETYGSNFEASGNFAQAGDFPTNYSPLLQ